MHNNLAVFVRFNFYDTILIIIWILSATMLVNGLLLKAAAAMTKSTIHFGFAMLVALASTIAGGMITYAMIFIFASPAEQPGAFLIGLIYAPGIITGLLTTAILCGLTAVDIEGKKIGFGKGMRIATIQLGISFGLAVVAGVVYIMFMGNQTP
jgi:hypothetical protein